MTLAKAYHAEPRMHGADLRLCASPWSLCALLEAVQRAPTVVSVCRHLLDHALLQPRAEQLQLLMLLRATGASALHHLSACSDASSAQVYYQTGVRLPVLHPLGLYT